MRHAVLLSVICMIVLVLMVPAVFAQDGGTAVDIAPALNDLLGALASIAVTILAAVAIWISRLLPPFIGNFIEAKVREIEARHREAYQSALRSAIDAAVKRFGVDLSKPIPIDVQNRIIADALGWVVGKGAGEAVRFFKLNEDAIRAALLGVLGVKEDDSKFADALIARHDIIAGDGVQPDPNDPYRRD